MVTTDRLPAVEVSLLTILLLGVLPGRLLIRLDVILELVLLVGYVEGHG